MRFLADESCDFAVVRALRFLGHDVAAVSESQQPSVDQELMEAAYREGRILLTEDKDFGWLACPMRRSALVTYRSVVPGSWPHERRFGRRRLAGAAVYDLGIRRYLR